MIKRFLLLFVVMSALAFGQASTVPPKVAIPLPATGVPVVTNVLPQNFAATGAMYNPSGTTKYTGWVTYAHLLDQKSGTYFFSSEDVIPVKGPPFTVQTSARVGIGTLLKQFGQVRVWAIVDGGGATTGTQSGGAASGRSCVTVPWRKTTWSGIGCYGVVVSNIVPGTPKVIEAGIGKSW